MLFRTVFALTLIVFGGQIHGQPPYAGGERLKNLAPPDFAIGGVMGGIDVDYSGSPILPLAISEFNAVTSKFFMAHGPWPNPDGPIDTSGLTNNVVWAAANDLRLHAHVLVYPTENVRLDWFRDLPNDQVESTLQNYVNTVAASSRGGVWVWDVVNEVIGDNGDIMDADGLRTALRVGNEVIPYKEYEAMGPGYIDKAFQWAKQADPNALLIINEYSAETVNDKSDRLLALCRRLRDQGVPIDGVGFQNHWLDTRYEPNFDSIRENFQRFANEGFQIFITECDIAAVHTQDPANNPPTPAELEQQARVFTELMRIAIEQPACKSFLMWDFTDESSWLQNTDFTLTLADRRPGFQDTIVPPGTSMFATPFWGGDGTVPIAAKPAYYGMQAVLQNRIADRYRVTSGWDRATSYLGRYGFQNNDGSWSPGDGVYLESLDSRTASWTSLIWQLEKVGTQTYRIRNGWQDGNDYLTRQPLDNNSNDIEPGSRVGMQGLNADWTSQEWLFIPAGNGGYRLANGWSPFDGVLTREAAGQNASGNYVPGSTVRLYPQENWSSQIWYFDRIGQ